MSEEILSKCYDCSKLEGVRQKSICDGTSGLSIVKQAEYLEFWLNQGLIEEKICTDLSPIESAITKPSWNASQHSRGFGDTIAKITSAVGIKPCGGCKERQEKLNKLIPYKKRKDNLNDIDSNVSTQQKNRILVLKEIEINTLSKNSIIVTEEQKNKRINICGQCPLNNKGICSECNCEVSNKILPQESFCPLNRWNSYGSQYKPLVNPIRDLIFHIYPKKGADWNWKWHIEQIKKYQYIFNGKIVIGMTVSKETEEPEVVKSLFEGISISEWIIKPNSKLAETETHLGMLRAIESNDENRIFFRFHTKGVTKKKDSVEQDWAKLLWEANMDIVSVEDALCSHFTCGAMRSLSPLVKGRKGDFFFAGSAYWMRSKEVFERNWQHTDKTRWWVEYLPGHLFTKEESTCLLYDLTEGSVIRQNHFDTYIRPEWEKWRRARGLKNETK